MRVAVPQVLKSNQSGVLFGYLFIAFLVFITLKGEISTYAGLLLLSPAKSGKPDSKTGADASSAASNKAAEFVGTALKAALF